ncbi:MAG TPA: putative lipid II flippase FtsW, partial [Xanthomonadaceae bacterium]|nr:putative lipid II flippase FtsW [Xanthomonadaceae bacterium]
MTIAKPHELYAQATRLDAIEGHYDRWLIGAVLALVVLGLVMITSASMPVAEALHVEDFHFVQKHLLALVLGGVLAWAALHLEIKQLERHQHLALLACFLLLLLVFVPGLGVRVNGATRWINVLVLNFQVVEAVKLLLVIWTAGYLARRRDELAADWSALLKPLGVVCLLVLLLLAQPDFGSSALLLAIVGGMIFLGGASLGKLALFGTPLVVAFAAMAVFEPYRLARITSFREPFEDPFGSGYQLVQALIAIGRGGFDGVGLGASVQKLQAFPEVHTDFIFAVLAEELGFLGVCLVLALFGVLLWRAFSIGLRCMALRRQFAGLLAFGIGLWIGIQASVSIGVNLGLLPTKGLTLPLISYGSSSTLMTVVALGVLLRVSYELDRAERQVQRARGETRGVDERAESVLPATLVAAQVAAQVA